MDLKEIVLLWLKAKGYDGLYQPGECGCDLNGLMPCESPCQDCLPGKKTITNELGDFIIGPINKKQIGVTNE